MTRYYDSTPESRAAVQRLFRASTEEERSAARAAIREEINRIEASGRRVTPVDVSRVKSGHDESLPSEPVLPACPNT